MLRKIVEDKIECGEFWLLEIMYEKHPSKYLTDAHGLTNNVYRAKRFENQGSAEAFKKKYLLKSLPNIKAIEHAFIDNN